MNKKVINNAMSAYFGVGALLLLPSKKENINHPFVKKHALTAIFIHFLMFITYLIFVTYSLGGGVDIYGYGLNDILATLCFLGLFGWLLHGVSKASAGNDFSIGDMATMSKTDKLVELKNSNLNEQGIITIILSLIPFIGFTLKGKFKNYKSPILENNFKLNLSVSLFISLFFVFSYENIGVLLMLLYTIFIVFYGVLLISKGNLIKLNLENIPTAEELYINTICSGKYLKNYFGAKEFIAFKTLQANVYENMQTKAKQQKEKLDILPEPKLSKYVAYIPVVNLLSIIDITSKNKLHVVYGALLTFVSGTLWYFGYNNYQILLFFCFAFGFGYTKIPEYRFPVLFDIYNLFAFLFGKIFSTGKKIKEKHSEIQEISFTNTNIQ